MHSLAEKGESFLCQLRIGQFNANGLKVFTVLSPLKPLSIVNRVPDRFEMIWIIATAILTQYRLSDTKGAISVLQFSIIVIVFNFWCQVVADLAQVSKCVFNY